MTIAEKLDACGGLATSRQLRSWPWLNASQLVERDASRQRLQAWIRAGAPVGPFTARVVPSRYHAEVSGVLAALPPPVAWHAAARVIFVGLRPGLAGQAAHVPRATLQPAFNDADQVVLFDPGLDDIDRRSVLGHEVAHTWTAPLLRAEDAPQSDLVAAYAAALNNGTPETDWSADDAAALQEAARGEELAVILAGWWGFRGVGTDLQALQRRGATNYVRGGMTR